MDRSPQSTNQLELVDLTEHITRTNKYCTALGGFGDVWRCVFQTGADHIMVAVKAIRPQDGGVDEKALRRELGTWKRLHHVNILPLLGIARDFGPYISMVSPWLENGSLTAYLRKYKDITLSDRLRLLEDITSGLHYLHGVQVVHGDLTPNNVLLNDERSAVLTDFGLSSMLVDQGHSYLQRSCAQPGAIRYTAPELLNPNSRSIQPDTRSDVYSFGCLTFQVLSGHEPWADIKHEICIIFKVAHGATPQRPANSQISDAHWHLIEQCFTPLGATPPRPSTGEILTFLESELQSKVSIAVISSTECSNEDEATTSFQDDMCIQTHSLLTIQTTVSTPQSTDPLATSPTVGIAQPVISPHNLPSGIRDKGKGPAMGSQRTGKFISSLFRRSKSAQLDKKISLSKPSIIATGSLTRVQNFAVPPGGLGNTFQCVWRNGVFKKKQKVAVKSIKALRNGDEESIRNAQETILVEVKRWMSLQHDNILPVYGTTTEFGSNLPCLVSPWMENGSLTNYLSTRRQTFSNTEKLMLLSQVVDGLHYLHSNNVLHGNLSSNNVLIDDRHTVRLADYGLSSIISACGDICSALRWTAPELIGDDDEDQVSSHNSDVYSFGCIALHVLSGRLPYWWLDDVLRVISARHRGEDPIGSGTEMGGGHDRFVRRCLSASPANRLTIDQIRSLIATSISN